MPTVTRCLSLLLPVLGPLYSWETFARSNVGAAFFFLPPHGLADSSLSNVENANTLAGRLAGVSLPESASLLLLGTGLIAMAALLRRRLLKAKS